MPGEKSPNCSMYGHCPYENPNEKQIKDLFFSQFCPHIYFFVIINSLVCAMLACQTIDLHPGRKMGLQFEINMVVILKHVKQILDDRTIYL